MMTKTLSFLLNQANRETKSREYYAVKDQILKKYGNFIGYDVQHIEGKKCFTCNGSGIYRRHDQYGHPDHDGCWSCGGNGWYKDPQWICLSRISFGKYIFHKPLKREFCVKNPFTADELGWDVTFERPIIDGYIEHNPAKFGGISLKLLYLIYNRKELLRIVKHEIRILGVGYSFYWWTPKNFINNVVHFIRRGRNAYPLKRIKYAKITPESYVGSDNIEELPF